MDSYLNALLAELRLRATPRPVATVYIGGGTPSFIGAERLDSMLDAIGVTYSLDTHCEITVEANPADMTAGWLAAARESGVNRLSVGIQSIRDEDLRFLGRRHSVDEAVSAFKRARAAGFENLSADMIVGLPGHTPEITRELLQRLVSELSPEHISCYQLTVADGTPLHDDVQRGLAELPGDETEADIFFATHQTLAALGYEGYEVSNFARTPTLRSRHNSAYWAHRDYLSFGPSAHSFIMPVRSWNTRSLREYCERLSHDELPVESSEELTRKQLAAEAVMLGLRTKDGVAITLLEDFGYDILSQRLESLREAEAQGFIIREGNFIKPTLMGMAIADRLAETLAE